MLFLFSIICIYLAEFVIFNDFRLPSPLRLCRSCPRGFCFLEQNMPLDLWSMYLVDFVDLHMFGILFAHVSVLDFYFGCLALSMQSAKGGNNCQVCSWRRVYRHGQHLDMLYLWVCACMWIHVYIYIYIYGCSCGYVCMHTCSIVYAYINVRITFIIQLCWSRECDMSKGMSNCNVVGFV